MRISLIMSASNGGGSPDEPDSADEDDNDDNDDAPPRKRIRSETGAASSSDPAGSSGFPVPKCPAPGCPPPKTGGHPKAKAKATGTPRTPKELSKAPPPLPPKAPQP